MHVKLEKGETEKEKRRNRKKEKEKQKKRKRERKKRMKEENLSVYCSVIFPITSFSVKSSCSPDIISLRVNFPASSSFSPTITT